MAISGMNADEAAIGICELLPLCGNRLSVEELGHIFVGRDSFESQFRIPCGLSGRWGQFDRHIEIVRRGLTLRKTSVQISSILLYEVLSVTALVDFAFERSSRVA